MAVDGRRSSVMQRGCGTPLRGPGGIRAAQHPYADRHHPAPVPTPASRRNLLMLRRPLIAVALAAAAIAPTAQAAPAPATLGLETAAWIDYSRNVVVVTATGSFE